MKTLKWVGIVVGGLVLFVILALLIVPLFVDIQKYKPEIETKVSEATGRPFRIGGDLSLSFFPWAGLSFSDLHLGNPPDFDEKDFVSVKSFDVKVKLIPLLSKDIQVKRFVLEGPRIALIKNKGGKTNWEDLGKSAGKASTAPLPKEKKPEEKATETGLPIKALAIAEMSIKAGTVLWVDQTKGTRNEVSDLNLRLEDVSLERPISLVITASVDGKPLSLEGKVGPMGKEPGRGTMNVDLALKALKHLHISIKGQVEAPSDKKNFDVEIQVAPFSPRDVMTSLGQPFPLKTSDPGALSRVGLKAKIKGNPMDVAIRDGIMELDQSKVQFSARAKEFQKPDMAFDLNVDKIDLDRYLPPAGEVKPAGEKKEGGTPEKAKGKTDYAPLRKLVLDGTVRIGELKAQGARVQDIHLKATAKNGLFQADPFTLKLYEGALSNKAVFDVQQDVPKSTVSLQAKGIKVGPLLKDLIKKEFLEGIAKADVDIRMEGDEPERIKKTLNGKGDILFNDGAIVGVDLAGMVRNVGAAFGLASGRGEKPRTDFSELSCPFTITNGVFHTPNTSMVSPLIRVIAAGKADLVQETLDFRVEPTFVATLKGQGDTKERSGLTVPVLVTGTFSDPKFGPDLKNILEKAIEKGIKDPSQLKDMLKGGGQETGGATKPEGGIKGILKGLPFGK